MRLPARTSHTTNILIITLAWIAAMLLVDPRGEFPLNDDWSYSKSVQHLCDTGELSLGDLPAMTLAAQILWGALWCKIAGFSFMLLRFSTLLLGLTGIIATYLLVCETVNNRRIALFAALLIAANPLFFSLSPTFMTDVPFYTFMTLSFLFYFRSFRSSPLKNIVIGTLLAIAATLTRQPGVFIPVAFAIGWMARSRTARERLYAIVPVLITVVSLFIYTSWLKASGKLPVSYADINDVMDNFKPAVLAGNLYHRTAYMALYCGLFFVPLFISGMNFSKTNLKKRSLLIIITALCIIPLIRAWSGFPLDNIINLHGIGPKALRDVAILNTNVELMLPQAVWDVIRSAGIAGGLVLIYIFLRRSLITWKTRDPLQVTAFSFILLYGGFLVVCNSFFDRYFLQLLGMLVIIVVPVLSNERRKLRAYAASALLILYSVFSISGTHEYIAWNRARWEALNYLMKEKDISPMEIDGGYEFNGWYETGPMHDISNSKSWWYVNDDKYLITFGPVAHYSEVKAFPYHTITGKEKKMWVLKREE
jgi:4-amino-4-deoxy-L-arabinose transferase-like glycosyltransferase